MGERFSGRIVIDPINATELATQAEYALPSHDQIVYWTDGSFVRDFPWIGSAVVWKDPEVLSTYRWKAKGFAVLQETRRTAESFAAEAAAIFKALEILEEHLAAGRVNRGATACILSDSQDVLAHVRRVPQEDREDYGNMCQAIVGKANALARNSSVSIRLFWCPGHNGIHGNELANEVARSAPMFADPMLLVQNARSAALAIRERQHLRDAQEKELQKRIRIQTKSVSSKKASEVTKARWGGTEMKFGLIGKALEDTRAKHGRMKMKSSLSGKALEDIRSRWGSIQDQIASSTTKAESPMAHNTEETDSKDSSSGEDVSTSEEEDTPEETDSGPDASSNKERGVSTDTDNESATISQAKMENAEIHQDPTDSKSVSMDISSDEGN
ncbi:MAG: hypothetical protein Q9165_003977 [Trypethelium subeluteriae]